MAFSPPVNQIEKDQGLEVEDILATVPFAIGAGVSVRDLIRQGYFSTPGKTGIEQNVMPVIEAFKNTNAIRMAQKELLKAKYLEEVKEKVQSTTPDILKESWIATVGRTQGLDSKIKESIGEIELASPEDVKQIIDRLTTDNKSISGKFLRKLSKNIQKLKIQQKKEITASLAERISTDPLEVTEKAIQPKEFKFHSPEATGVSYATTDHTPFDKQLSKIEQAGAHRLHISKSSSGEVYRVSMETDVGSVKFHLPIARDGIITEGRSMQTRRIAPDYLVIDSATGDITERVPRHEMMLREIEATILPDIASGKIKNEIELRKAVKELRQNVFGELESRSSFAAKYDTSAQKIREKIRTQQVDLVTTTSSRKPIAFGAIYSPSFRRLREPELVKALEVNIPKPEVVSTYERPVLYGGVSPEAAAKGRMSLIDVSEFQVGGKLTDWARRPEQFAREYSPSITTVAKLEQSVRHKRYLEYRSTALRKAETIAPNVIEPITVPMNILYLNPESVSSREIIEKLGMQEGTVVGKRSLKNVLSFESTRVKYLSRVAEIDIDTFREKIKAKSFSVGDIIGFDTEGGAVKYDPSMDLIDAIEKVSDKGGVETALVYRDVRRLQHGDKFFGDIKATMLLRDDRNLWDIVTQNSNIAPEILKDVDVIATMDDLKKDPGKLARQMLTATAEALQSKPARAIGEIELLRLDPTTAFETMMKRATNQSGDVNKELLIENLMQTLKHTELTPVEFGNIFAGAKFAIGAEKIENIISKVHAEDIDLGDLYKNAITTTTSVSGIANIAYDKPPEMLGAGMKGSIEPRFFELLKGGMWKDIGPDIQQEFAERLALSNPEKVSTNIELGKTLSSMMGGSVDRSLPILQASTLAEKHGPANWEKFIKHGGGILELGQGLNPIYIPGMETMESMALYETAEGIKTKTQIRSLYDRIQRVGENMYDDQPISIKEAVTEIENIQQDIWKQFAPAGKGGAAIQRGKLEGSRFLRATPITESGIKAPDLQSPLISEKTYKGMVNEMIEIGQYTPEQGAKLIREAEQGLVQNVPILAWRHPGIDEASIQMLRANVVKGDFDQVVMPETVMSIDVGGESRTLRLGPNIGFAGDYDADNIAVMLVSPKLENKITAQLNNSTSTYQKNWAEQQIRYSLLRPKKATSSNAMSIRDEMIAGTQKTAGAKVWVAPVSLQLSKAKQAINLFAETPEQQVAGNMLSTLLEQVPISAKHMSAERVKKGGLGSMMTELAAALDEGRGITPIVEEMLDLSPGTRQAFEGDINISKEDAVKLSNTLNVKIGTSIKAPSIKDAAEVMESSIRRFKGSSEAQKATALAGRGIASSNTMASIVEETLASSNQQSANMFSKVSSAALDASNTLGKLGRGIIQNYKPLGMGLAASLGIAAILSQPKELVGPGAALSNPTPDMQGTKGSSRVNESLTPPPLGSPTAPNLFRSSNVRLSSQSRHTKVTASTSSGAQTNAMLRNIASTSGNSNLKINLRDNRSEMDSNVFANQLVR